MHLPSGQQNFRLCLGLDPGITTGFALWDCEQHTLVNSGTIQGWQLCYELLRSTKLLAVDGRELQIVVEDFVGGGLRSVPAIHTLQLLGFITGVCEAVLDLPCAIQAPQLRRPFLTEAKVLVPNENSVHARDALAHILYFLWRDK